MGCTTSSLPLDSLAQPTKRTESTQPKKLRRKPQAQGATVPQKMDTLLKEASAQGLGRGHDLQGYAHLKGFRLVWYDPNVESSENKEYQPLLNALFAKCTYCTAAAEVFTELANDVVPIVVLSNGASYLDIRTTVEEAGSVVGIFIFCMNTDIHQHFALECRKVLAVSGYFEDLKQELKRVHKSIQRQYRYSPHTQQTFYNAKDAWQLRQLFDCDFDRESECGNPAECNYSPFFYPIGFGGGNLGELLSEKQLDALAEEAKKNIELQPHRDDIQRRISELKETPRGTPPFYPLLSLWTIGD